MKNKISVRFLALGNLVQRPFRTAGLIAVVTVISFALCSGAIVALSLKKGINSMQERLGADLIVLPKGYETEYQTLLIQGEPNYFYFSKDYVEKIAQMTGVEQVSAQYFLTSTGESCCDFPVQIIGFEPETDFTVQPWIEKTFKGKLKNGSVIIGGNIGLEAGKKSVRFFNKSHPVAARLSQSGSGLDNAIFASTQTIISVMEDAKAQGFGFLSDREPNEAVSCILVKVTDSSIVNSVAIKIRTAFEDVQVLRSRTIISGLSDTLGGFSLFVYIFIFILLVLAIVVLSMIFSISINERKKELSVLRMLGATQKYISKILFSESFFISFAGGIIGIMLACALVFPFSVLISSSFHMPYLTPSFINLCAVFLLTLFASSALGPVASSYSVYKITQEETYLNLREGE